MKVKSKIVASIMIFVMTMPAMASGVNELDIFMKMVLMEKKSFEVSDRSKDIKPVLAFNPSMALPSIEEQSASFKYKQDISYDNSRDLEFFSK